MIEVDPTPGVADMSIRSAIDQTFAQKALTKIADGQVRNVSAKVRIEVDQPAESVTNSVMQAIGKEMRKQGLPGFWGDDHQMWREAVHALVTNTMVNDAFGKIATGLTTKAA